MPHHSSILRRRFYTILESVVYNRQKFEQAVAAGAAVNEDYWKLISGKIYAVTPITTPIAVTPVPPDATPPAH